MLQNLFRLYKKYDSEILALVPVVTNTGHFKKFYDVFIEYGAVVDIKSLTNVVIGTKINNGNGNSNSNQQILFELE